MAWQGMSQDSLQGCELAWREWGVQLGLEGLKLCFYIGWIYSNGCADSATMFHVNLAKKNSQTLEFSRHAFQFCGGGTCGR
jgi:hypothetical protein